MMSGMKKLMVLLAALLALIVPFTATSQVAHAARSNKVWAFCGVEPDDPNAVAQLSVLLNAGITATFGPCRAAPANYTPANPGTRYATFTEYYHLTSLNAVFGMKTVVYDSRIFSSSSTVRSLARAYWKPQLDLGRIAAFDLGDEYDPNGPEWSTLVSRWNLVRGQGFTPYTNVVGTINAVYIATATLPGLGNYDISFDNYEVPLTVSLAQTFNPAGRLMCAVNAIPQAQFPAPTGPFVASTFAQESAAGCDDWLIFTGIQPQPVSAWPSPSLVTANGTPTALVPYIAAAP